MAKELTKERWNGINAYPDYRVSDHGRMEALNYYNRHISKILDLHCDKGRYLKVTLKNEEGSKTFWVHQLVAEAFCDGKDEVHFQVDHIDGNKLNNVWTNLRFVSPKDNSNNPNTKGNYHIRYHKEGEKERRSAGQKKRFERPEERARLLDQLAKGREKRNKKKPPRDLDGSESGA